VALAAALAVGAACVGLLIVCWRRRTVLGGVCALAGIALVAVAIAARHDAADAVLAASAALVIGAVLFGLGQAVQQLLDDDPDD